MKKLQKERFEKGGGNLPRQKIKLSRRTKIVSFIFSVMTILTTAGIMQAANVYYDLDSSTIMTTEKQSMAGDLTVTSGDVLFSTTGTITQSGLGNVSFAGNVGIGTASPTGNFQVAQSATGVGTVSNAVSGTTVTGNGTQFLNTFKVGDTITIVGQTVAISAIASNTSMTTAAITNANSGVAYTLVGGTRFSVLGSGKVGIGDSTTGFFTYLQGSGTQTSDITYTLPAAVAGGTGYVLSSNASGVLSWSATAAATAHDLLDGGINQDTVAQGVTRGSLIVGNATPKWDELVLGTAGKILRSDGTDALWSMAAYPDTTTINQLLFSSAANTVAGVTAGTSGQFLVANGSGVPTFVTASGDATIAADGAITLADVALGTKTSGNYVATITGGSGISSTGATTGETINHTLSLGALSVDWTQSGAYDIILGNIGSELKIMGSGGTYYGIFDVGNITTADKTYTFPDQSGTVAMTSDLNAFEATGILRGQANIFGFDYPAQCSTSCNTSGVYTAVSRDILALPNFPAVLSNATRTYRLVVRYGADMVTAGDDIFIQAYNVTTSGAIATWTVDQATLDNNLDAGFVFVSGDFTAPATDDWDVRVGVMPTTAGILRIYSIELAAYDIN